MKSINKFAKDYIKSLTKAILKSNFNKLDLSVKELLKTIHKNGTIYVCGNGGSAAIANHYVVDFLKYFREKTKLKPKIQSLSNNIETITAISNDVGYNDVFINQLRIHYKKGDKLLVISASGNSKNIILASDWVKSQGGTVIGFLGFDGGKLFCPLSV